MKYKFAWFAAMLFAPLASLHAATSSKPNVLLIMPDDVSFGDYSFYNERGPRTPNVDALGRQSLRLSDFHVAPTCSPSRSQLMTGRYTDECGAWHTVMGRYFLRTNDVTMADVFKANGYRTAMFGKWHLGDSYPFRPKDRGFEHCVMIRGGGIDQQPNPWGIRNSPPSILFNDDKPVVLDDKNGPFSTDYFTTEAIAYMKKCQTAKEPFFLYLPYNVVHGPQDMPPDARKGANAHTATIENMDKNIGRLLRFLDESSLAENTLLVFILGDNGMANSMLRGGKSSEYEGGHRVPCFVRWPAGGYAGTAEKAREIEQMTTEMDLLPTFMNALGLHDVANRSPELAMAGRSIKALFEDKSASFNAASGARILVVDNQREDNLIKYKQACVMQDESDGDGKIVHKWRLMRPSPKASWELYDIAKDPHQKDDLLKSGAVGSYDKLTGSLKDAYEAWWKQISAHASEYARPIIRTSEEPETCLYSHDWHIPAGVPPWNHAMIAAGPADNGFSPVTFEHAGQYTFDLRRWPREIEGETSVDSQLRSPIRAGDADLEGKWKLTNGKALPVRSARIRVWNDEKTYADERQDVKPNSDGSIFTLKMPAGPAMVQTWFYDADGKELCGAYYVYVRGN